MSRLTPDQQRTRQRIESLIAVMSPALNLVLAAGERLARLVEPEDYDYLPPRPAEGQVGEADDRAARTARFPEAASPARPGPPARERS